MFRDYDLLAQSGLFNADYYVAANPDVASSNWDPLLHYVERGAKEGRSPNPEFDVAYYIDQCRIRGDEPSNALLHFITVGAREGLKARRVAEVGGLEESNGAALGVPQDDLMFGIDAVSVDTMSDESLQLTVRGWSIAPEEIVEIHLSMGETILGYGSCGRFSADVAALYPDIPRADHCGYMLTVDALPPGHSASLELTLLIATAAGVSYRRHFEFDVKSSTLTRKFAESEARTTPKRRAPPPAPLRLEVDEIEVNSRGVLHVSGWAACYLDLSAVRILVGDIFIGLADYGHARDDVALAFPEYPRSRHSGFHFKGGLGHLGAGRKYVKVQALTQSGTTREAIFPVEIPDVPAGSAEADVFNFHCDEIALSTRGAVAIKGWAVCGAPTASISVRIDDIEAGSAELDIERPDVGNIFGHCRHARRAGFAFVARLNVGLVPGEHIITLTVKDTDGLVRAVPLPIHAVESSEESTAPVSGAVDNDPDLAVFIDLPGIVNGAADTSVTSSLSIAGWTLARSGVKSIDIAVDGKHISRAHYGVRREDVASVYPNRSDALMSGFAALIPNWVLPKGEHTLSITVTDSAGQTGSVDFKIQVEAIPEGEGPWSIRKKIAQSEILLTDRILAGLKWQPVFHVLVKLHDSPGDLPKLYATLNSLRAQAYGSWSASLVVIDRDVAPSLLKRSILADFADIAGQLEVFSGNRSQPISAVSPKKHLRNRDSLFICTITAGDVLGCDALLELAVVTGMEREADFVYSDERRLSPVTRTLDAYFKPAWSPDLLLSSNYIGRLWVAKHELFGRAKLSVADWLKLGDYELVLRCTEAAQSIKHLPKVLCERDVDNVDSADSEKASLARALVRRGQKATVKNGCTTGVYRVKRRRKTRGLVSIIIPTCAARGLVKACLESLKSKTSYKNYEIICIENIPEEKGEWKRWLRENADQVIETFEPFNWSRYNNLCAARASGEFLLFLNDDIEVIEPNWLDTLLQQAERPEVGAVGPQLLYGDRSVQHAGLALTALGKARHTFRHAQPDDPGYFGLALTERNVIGVTGACLLTRREVFDAVGRFDEAHTIVNNDLDYCLKTWRHGYLNIYTPHAQLIHHELASRGEMGDTYDNSAFVGEWRDVFIKGDPYLNPNLSREVDDLSPEREPIKILSAGHPLIAADTVRKILVVKLDHIGDCLTALPALRRLKELFPNAQFSVLSNRATRSIWDMESAVAETLEFDFFHARSGLGKKELAEADLLELRRRLEPLRFDLAVDLRKSPDTRSVLRYTGARFLAGFDYRGEYPWLDIALEWEGDTRYAVKRQHVADDLLNLVEAIGTSCRSERSVFQADPKIKLGLPAAEQKAIFDKRVVCIHPAAGTEMRQWPPAYFAELIDLILAAHDVNVIIIGGPDEMDIAQKVLDELRNPGAVFCLVGKSKLVELPVLIAKCALFIGNNSGPKHIAAALGVPTIGVHSGVIDSNEWGPLGDNAVAIRRDMSCSPCYIEKRGDCPKDLACIRRLEPGRVFELASRMLAIDRAPFMAQRQVIEPVVVTGQRKAASIRQ